MKRIPSFLETFMVWLFAMALLFTVDNASATNIQPSSTVFSGYAGQMMNTPTAAIANGQTVSAAVTLKGFSLVGILLPATFTGTTLTFQVSFDCSTYVVLKSTTSGSSLSYTVAQNTYAAIDPVPFYGVNCLKIVSGSAEGGARTLTLSVKGI